MKIKRRIKYYLLRLFRLKASPQQIAFGMTLGFIPCWFPTFGMGPLISIGIARAFKGNLFAAVIGGVIGTPIWPILFFMNYRMGSLFFIRKSHVDELEEVHYHHAINETLGSIQSGSFLFLTGAVINVVISSFVIYFVVYILFKRYRVNSFKSSDSNRF